MEGIDVKKITSPSRYVRTAIRNENVPKIIINSTVN